MAQRLWHHPIHVHHADIYALACRVADEDMLNPRPQHSFFPTRLAFVILRSTNQFLVAFGAESALAVIGFVVIIGFDRSSFGYLICCRHVFREIREVLLTPIPNRAGERGVVLMQMSHQLSERHVAMIVRETMKFSHPLVKSHPAELAASAPRRSALSCSMCCLLLSKSLNTPLLGCGFRPVGHRRTSCRKPKCFSSSISSPRSLLKYEAPASKGRRAYR